MHAFLYGSFGCGKVEAHDDDKVVNSERRLCVNRVSRLVFCSVGRIICGDVRNSRRRQAGCTDLRREATTRRQGANCAKTAGRVLRNAGGAVSAERESACATTRQRGSHLSDAARNRASNNKGEVVWGSSRTEAQHVDALCRGEAERLRNGGRQ